jgi:dolichyl-phosphate-mannose--protein O-mannosyl transferase
MYFIYYAPTYAVAALVASRSPSLARSSCAPRHRRTHAKGVYMSHTLVVFRHISAFSFGKAHRLSFWLWRHHRSAHLVRLCHSIQVVGQDR